MSQEEVMKCVLQFMQPFIEMSAKQMRKRDEQIDKLILAIAESTKAITKANEILVKRGEESDERMRKTNDMIHLICKDNHDNHESYAEQMRMLAECRNKVVDENKYLAECLNKLTDRVAAAERSYNELLAMFREVALAKSSAQNINVSK